jgi:alcohol dehydrogenase
MEALDFNLTTRLICGCDSIDRLGELAASLGSRRAMVISDPGIVAVGHVQRGIDSLNRAGVESILFDGARENPTTREIELGVEDARDCQPDLLIGLGGGSSMDCAKGINFVYSCGGRMPDYLGVGKATGPMLPLIAVPTTAGTGSEMQSFAIIADAQSHMKMACGDKRAAAKIALLDPRLTLTQPSSVTALTGMDAISHALETYVTKRRNSVSLMFSREAWRLLSRNFLRVIHDGDDLEARSAMQLGAAYAGVAIENSMLGASHALANPLTATYGLAHGQAVGLMLPHVIRFNGEIYDDWYRELLAVSDCHSTGNPVTADFNATNRLAELIEGLLRQSGLSQSLDQLNVEFDRLPELATSAAQQWTGTFNPRPVDHSTLLEIYQSAF